ncbi:MAG TPA: GDP-mannose dehydrogenase, partial [Burkholderiales bacterium]|nr:GDP-mannose dehydrogenase [Burkholderiales bacterium]
RVPHISRLMVSSVGEVMSHADTIVIGNASPEFTDVPERLRERQSIVDLVRINGSRSVAGVYEGLCW